MNQTPSSPFYLSTKPVGSLCNLDCKYCYYLEKSALYQETSSHIMTEELMIYHIEEYMKHHPSKEVLFTWHGGEPLLRGIDFYRKVIKTQIELAQKYNKKFVNSLQTNGTLLNHEWCAFFKENFFLIGISIDGPEDIHNVYRKTPQGESTFQETYKGLLLLQEHQVEYNILTTINNFNVKFPTEIYQFFKNSNSRFIQFTPIVERSFSERKSLLSLASPLERNSDLEVTPWSVLPEEYGQFLIEIFDQWVKTDVGSYFVINFDAMLANWLGVPPPICTAAESCGHAVTMEHNGDIYACDHFVFPEYFRGNIQETSLKEIVNTPDQIQFGQNKQTELPSQCKTCTYLFACNGECPKNRFTNTDNGEPGLNYFCIGFKNFYDHINPYMNFMVEELHNERSPANIMLKLPFIKPS